MKKCLYLLLLLAYACQQAPQTPEPRKTVRVALDISPEQQAVKTRATDENSIQDVNIFFYGSGRSYHFYATGASIQVDIAPGTYSIEVAANLHKDMGDLSSSQFSNYKVEAPTDATMTMYGWVSKKIDLTTTDIPVTVKRNAAKIAYNITVAPSAGNIEILSVQLCSLPNKDLLAFDDRMDLTDPIYGFYDSGVHTLPEGSVNVNGVFYMLSNRRGENNAITDQKQKNAKNAPEDASYFRIRARKGDNKIIEYVVYLGANATSDFNVWPNEAHTYNIKLVSDKETDTRITSYQVEVVDWWPRAGYNSTSDTGQLEIMTTNTTAYTLTGKLIVKTGEKNKFAAADGSVYYGPEIDLWIPDNNGARYDLMYTPNLISRGVNSHVEYQVVINDDTGESLVFSFSHEFANKVLASFPGGTGSVTVTGALDKTSTTTSVTAYCFEDGCTFTAADGNGYLFDGWYADKAYTQLLSAAAQYKFVPAKAVSTIYAKFALAKQPKVEIRCSETNKNSTYMFNKNNVSMTVTDYSGPVTIKATCASGGIFTSTTSFTRSVTSGQSFSIGELVFVPTTTGNVSYTIDVTTSTGIKIGSKTVTNTIAATKLTPNISISYGLNTRQTSYRPAYSSTYVYWYGYRSVSARVAFTPALDYPTPIEGTELIRIQLNPTYRVYEISGTEDPGTGQWAPIETTIQYPNISNIDFVAITPTYADSQGTAYTLVSASALSGSNAVDPLFAPYTDGETYLEMPFTESEAIAAKMMNRTFIKYKFNANIQPTEIKLTSIYNKSDLQLETTFSKISITNNLN